MRLGIFFYSTYGHIFQMAEKAKEGAQEIGSEADILKVAETLPEEILEKMGAIEPQKAFADVPAAKVDDLLNYDGFIFAFPTRYGSMAAQFKSFVDATGALWQQGKLIGKPFGLMTSSATQHGGQESTLLTGMVPFLHHGMIFVGLPQSEAALFGSDVVSGGSFYGATTIAGPDGARMPSEAELNLAKALGKRVAEISAKLAK